MTDSVIRGLYYIAHIDNVASILTHGILSHSLVREMGIDFARVYDQGIVERRGDIQAPDGTSLWRFANLYFQPRNAMLYRVLREHPAADVVVLQVRPDILNRDDIYIATGNAAAVLSKILPKADGLKRISEIREILDKEYWSEEDGSKRKMMAECLVPDLVPPESIQAIHVADREAGDKVEEVLGGLSLPVIPEPHMFFRPVRRIQVAANLWLVEGDMFFSRCQTLTVSVNCVGVMGAGLASRAKYQFPDVYVKYQDLCRAGDLQMGRPYLYKRETSLDDELADEPSAAWDADWDTWFLLFPTKKHWKQRADVGGIEQGLQWLTENYTREGIESLAVPALGCGLGWLEWEQVGPLLCRYLAVIRAETWLYLPAEKKLPDELLSAEFLLG